MSIRGDERQRAALQVDDAGAGVVDRAVAEAQAVAESAPASRRPTPSSRTSGR